MAWTQNDFNSYIGLVRAANPKYERFLRSNLHTLTDLLRPTNFVQSANYLGRITAAWNAVPADRKRTYALAWNYVNQTLFPPVVPLVQPPVIVQPRGGQALGAIANAARQKVQEREVRMQASEIVCDEALQQVNNGTTYDWRVKFRIRNVLGGKQAQSMAVTIKLAAYSGNGPEQALAVRNRQISPVPAGYAGVTLNDNVKLNWKSRIVERWSGACFVVRDVRDNDLDSYKIEWDFDWAEGASAAASNKIYAVRATSNAVPADGTINTHYWGVDDGGSTGAAIAHEFGHLIGNPDEYGVTTFKGQTNVRNARSIMDNETTGASTPGHYWMVANKIVELLGVSADRCVVRLNNTEYLVSADHPWG